MGKTENSAPNIVLIVTDQQRWDTLGCLGYDHVITPHIDRLAASGVAFRWRGCRWFLPVLESSSWGYAIR